MAFDLIEIAIELAHELKAPLARLRLIDKDLDNQARRAANGIALQAAEARCRAGKDRLHLFRVAKGSTDELSTALRLAQAWGYLEPQALAASLALLDRIRAMLWRLSR